MHAEEGLAKATRLGFQRGIGSALRFLGLASYREGDFKLARTRLEAMLRVWEDLDDQSEIGWSLIVLGGLSRDQGDYSEAHRLLSQCLLQAHTAGAPGAVASALDALSGLASVCGQHERALRLSGAASALFSRAEYRGLAMVPTSREQWLARDRQVVGADMADRLMAEGRDLLLNEAIREGLAIQADAAAPIASQLTPREQEVATLISRGRTNRQIAEELVIAVSTTERHVANILRKLDLSTRTQIAAWVHEHYARTTLS
jgi:DNA-binding CsgD family transcriptional regulator